MKKDLKKYKFLSLIALLILTISFTSCSDDDGNIQDPLVGVWDGGNVINNGDVGNIVMTIKSDGTGDETYIWEDGGGTPDYFNWTASGDKLTLGWIYNGETDPEDADTWTYEIYGDQLTLSFESEQHIYTRK